MTIRAMNDKAAVARLSALRFLEPIEMAAQRLAEWQANSGGFIVPIAVPLVTTSGSDTESTRALFKDRAARVRAQIAKTLGMDQAASRGLTFLMTAKDAWYLGSRPRLDQASMLSAVAAAPGTFIELMLYRELVEAAAFERDDTFVTGGFGPRAYLGGASQVGSKRLHLAEAGFSVNRKHGFLLCDVASKVYVRKAKETSACPAASTRLAEVGEGQMVNITRLEPNEFFEMDARRYPMLGLSMDSAKFRQTRLYYLNVLTEFALRLFAKAGVPVEQETFVASHCVDDGYIPLGPIAQLLRPLEVVNATDQKMDLEALRPLLAISHFFPEGFHVAGNTRVHFHLPVVEAATAVPSRLTPERNYLFLNGEGDADHGSVRTAKLGIHSAWTPAALSAAYLGLARGDAVADPYTQLKYAHLMAMPSVSISMQGLDRSPAALSALLPARERKGDRPLQEAIKRCLVELSLKESLLGLKPIPTPAMPRDIQPASLTLLATRHLRLPGRHQRKQLVAVVDVRVDELGISVEQVRRSPWAQADMALIDFVAEFPFLQSDGREWIRDGQFWLLDRGSGERLTSWAGAMVPKIILNDDHDGIETALAHQDDHRQSHRARGGGRYYSKSQHFNLLPYYMSMYRAGEAARGERTGTRIPVQDRGAFLRVFVPPEGGIKGAGNALSGMRDLMVYAADGTQVTCGLINRPIVRLYLHTMTNGVLVGGDNSKMSVLEKLARLALEN